MNAMTYLRERVAKIVPSRTGYADDYVDELSRTIEQVAKVVSELVVLHCEHKGLPLHSRLRESLLENVENDLLSTLEQHLPKYLDIAKNQGRQTG